MENVKNHISRLACKLYSKNQLSFNNQFTQLGQFNPIFNKHKIPCAV